MRPEIEEFQQKIWGYYTLSPRALPWRETNDPYSILVSEIMLQQTQVDRVIPKYLKFLDSFPTVQALAAADTSLVLQHWQGLGYNSRGLRLHQLAKQLAPKGKIPQSKAELLALPGVGDYTASAVLAFAFHIPVVMIETNIRRVMIDYFFPEQMSVSDHDILPLIQESLSHDNPREWYYALMDYGAYLKKIKPNANKRSKSYAVQSKFEGSDRQIRGALVRQQLLDGHVSVTQIADTYKTTSERVSRIAAALKKESYPLVLV